MSFQFPFIIEEGDLDIQLKFLKCFYSWKMESTTLSYKDIVVNCPSHSVMNINKPFHRIDCYRFCISKIWIFRCSFSWFKPKREKFGIILIYPAYQLTFFSNPISGLVIFLFIICLCFYRLKRTICQLNIGTFPILNVCQHTYLQGFKVHLF